MGGRVTVATHDGHPRLGKAQFWADAAALTEDLFGSATSANVFVVGMAVQAGCLPIASEKVEEAIARITKTFG